MQFDDLGALLLLASSPLHPASLLVCVPAAKSSLPVLSAYSLRISLTFSYGWRHRPRRAPFIPIVSLPAKHTGGDGSSPAAFDWPLARFQGQG